MQVIEFDASNLIWCTWYWQSWIEIPFVLVFLVDQKKWEKERKSSRTKTEGFWWYTGCPINMETRSTLFSHFLSVLLHLDFDFFQKIRLFFRVGKKRNKTEIFFGAEPPPTTFFQNVPRFCFLRFIWIWRKNKIPCTVHGFEEETKFHVPGYMNLRKQNLWTFWKKRWWGLFRFVSFCSDPTNYSIFLKKNQNQGGLLKVWI